MATTLGSIPNPRDEADFVAPRNYRYHPTEPIPAGAASDSCGGMREVSSRRQGCAAVVGLKKVRELHHRRRAVHGVFFERPPVPAPAICRCSMRSKAQFWLRNRRVPAETMPDANAIPVIDLGPYLAGELGALDHAAAELRHALTEIGFYTIVNHGVPSALVHEV